MAEEPKKEMTDAEALQEMKVKVAKAANVPIEDLEKTSVKMTPELKRMIETGELKMAAQGTKVVERGKPANIPQQAYQRPNPSKILEARYDNVIKDVIKRKHEEDSPLAHRGRDLTPDAVKQAAANAGTSTRPALSRYMEKSQRLNKMVLAKRPAGAPSILEECRLPIKLMVSQHQSPGDIIMLSAAIRDLHKAYPKSFVTCMRTPCNDIWTNNPNHKRLHDEDPDIMWISCEYPLINTCNEGAHHFIHGFRMDLESKLGIPIPQGPLKGDVHLTPQEKAWFSQLYEMFEKNIPFWIIDAGSKSDFTCKQWEPAKYQAVVDGLPDVTFVQIGSKDPKHRHTPLKGKNVIDLIGKTSIRQLIRLVYHSAGVITPVSFPMHLAAAVEMHPRYKRRARPCVVIAGGREPAVWEAYTNHQFLHTCGMLPCCDAGGCWASRVEPIFDGDLKDVKDLCARPVKSASGVIVPKCMDMIQPKDVIEKVQLYQEVYDFEAEDDSKWRYIPHENPKEVTDLRAKAAAEHKQRQKQGKQPKK
jgi:ADP-heptose:LPS heptosyltransferase